MEQFRYPHRKIEQYWQNRWVKKKLFKFQKKSKKPKDYILDMFPYPSGVGLHVGHPEGYTATDIFSRYKRMRGFNVMHPMGWDAFGLPAENYAIQSKIHPEKSTLSNIKTFKRQIQELGFSYDWEREVSTCDPSYYRWTQWFFAFLQKQGLVYKKTAPVNWCESCKTVLANEQVVDGNCERCKNSVFQKELAQWFFKITAFLEDQGTTTGLINGLQKIDWPESTKTAQLNWIGKSIGCNVAWKVLGNTIVLETFTTTVDTIYGVTFMVISPEHPLLNRLITAAQKEEVEKYRENARRKTELERLSKEKEKTGVLTGSYVLHPFTGARIPIFVADYVLMNYGTGVVMGVPAHDQRDMDFAKKHQIPIVQSVALLDGKSFVYDNVDKYRIEGKIVDSGEFTGLSIMLGREKIIERLHQIHMGRKMVVYKMRDWLVSRQRYWGAPIPIVYDDKDVPYLVPDNELPVMLPKDVDFMPTGESPLVRSKSFHNNRDLLRIEKKLKKSGALQKDRRIVRRESDTMDTFVCSSWYFFRFMDPKNKKTFADKKICNAIGPVDLYVGGAEHTVLHLLYARFFAKALHRGGLISYDEPFLKLRHQGMILGEDGEKMSKSRGNVINPDEIVRQFGADTLRMYEMFMGPFDQMKPWSTKGVQGIFRFLQKVWRLATEVELSREKPDKKILRLSHQTLKKVTLDIEDFKFNTAISQMMVMVNYLQGLNPLPKQPLEMLVFCLYPFAPHLSEELWKKLGHKKMIMEESWPEYDPKLAKEDEIELPIQVNGKVRATINVPVAISQHEAIVLAKSQPNVAKYLKKKKIVKEIFVPGKIVNIVIR